jgi:phosphate ABC transporter phosphate-binding protein
VREVKPALRTGTPRGARARSLALVIAALTACSAGLSVSAPPAAAATFVAISGAGSTWSFNAINDWTTNIVQFGMPVNYQPVGSASGRQEFAGGTVDFGASDIPYGVQDVAGPNPLPTRGYTYMPDTAGAVAFMYNLHIGGQQVTNLRLSGAVIAGIFTNAITRWNDPLIAADNPGLTLPDEPIVPVVRTDSSGSTWQFTQWLSATQSSYWSGYCTVVGRTSCTPTTGYPVQSGTAMVGQQGDLGVTGYVSQSSAEGAIGYTEYAYALETGFPVANVLNAAGYYTAPTPQNVGVSLLNAQIDENASDPLYQTAELSNVYADTDPRAYELSYYSYMILPTDASFPLPSAGGGYTVAAFGQFALCQGQIPLDALGYAALPINLVEAGYGQLLRVPGASLPASTSAFIASCNNPTFASDGTDTLANTAPMPPACDRQAPVQCDTPLSPTAASVAIDVTNPITGSLTVTVAAGTVDLTVSGYAATGALSQVTVSDTRNNSPGWSVSGQAADFTGSGSAAGSTISGNQLGWIPTLGVGPVGAGVTLGGTVTVPPGLGTTAAVLASAPAGRGFGTSALDASLFLLIPPTARPGIYTSTLTVTVVAAQP